MSTDQKQARANLLHDLEHAEQTMADLVAALDEYLTQIPEGEFYGSYGLAHMSMDDLMRAAAKLKAQTENVRRRLEG